MDPETMYDSISNVGVKNGRIAVITKEPIEGNETIDATSLVVAPGFIDTHVHGVTAVPYKKGGSILGENQQTVFREREWMVSCLCGRRRNCRAMYPVVI
jgi:imidazolonepropionase-like amidohydrolase